MPLDPDPYKADVAGDARKKQRAEEKRHQAEEDLQNVLSTASGRRFVWRLISASGTFAKSFEQDPGFTAFNEGRRSIGISLMTEAQKLAPERYLLMVEERITDEIETARREKNETK